MSRHRLCFRVFRSGGRSGRCRVGDGRMGYRGCMSCRRLMGYCRVSYCRRVSLRVARSRRPIRVHSSRMARRHDPLA